jgi:hypothetical protein
MQDMTQSMGSEQVIWHNTKSIIHAGYRNISNA